jgi:hypothetical protein
MMNMNNQHDILRWVHGEMQPDEKIAFAKAMTQDPRLAQEVEKVQRFHQDIHALSVIPDVQSDAYADHLLGQIDTEFPLEQAVLQERNKVLPFPSTTPSRRTWPRAFRWALAAAASLAVLLGPGLLRSPLEWAPCEFITDSEYRHPGLTVPGKTISPQMKQLALDLQQSIQQAYESSKDWEWWPSKEWLLCVTIQETHARRLAVTVVATSAEQPAHEKDWTEYYRDVEVFRSSLESLGNRIGSELAKEPAHDMQ